MLPIDLTKKYALAVSGGQDSMCMLNMFVKLHPRPDFFVVTVNHGIRPDAAGDCKFVADYCSERNVPCIIEEIDVPTYAEQNKLSTETAARVLRYKVLDGLDVDYVCLAHHKTDNAETVLMHIFRGSGAAGAEGIRPYNGKYFRPLSDMTRDEISAYVLQNNVPFVTDSTNSDTQYTRNYLRHNVLPVIKQVYPDVENSVARFAANIARDNEYLDGIADISTVHFAADCAEIPTKLLTQPYPIAARVLRKTFAKLGVYADVETSHIDALLRLASGDGGKKLNLSNGFRAYNDYEFVTLQRGDNGSLSSESGALNGNILHFCVPFDVGETQLPIGRLVVSRQPLDGCLRIDMHAMPDGCVVRYPTTDDNFTKFGGGTKPLRRYLTDKKIPQRMRKNIPVIACGNDILVVCGVEISDKVKVGSGADIVYIKYYMEEK